MRPRRAQLLGRDGRARHLVHVLRLLRHVHRGHHQRDERRNGGGALIVIVVRSSARRRVRRPRRAATRGRARPRRPTSERRPAGSAAARVRERRGAWTGARRSERALVGTSRPRGGRGRAVGAATWPRSSVLAASARHARAFRARRSLPRRTPLRLPRVGRPVSWLLRRRRAPGTPTRVAKGSSNSE